MTNYTNKAVGLFVVFALALAFVPATSAQATGGFGRVVTASTPDSTFVLTPIALGPVFCYVDTDGSAAFSPSEPVYLQPVAACAATATNNVRLANPTTGVVGSQVTGTDNDVGRATLALTHIACFFDSNGDGRFSASGSDVLYASVPVGGVCTTAKIGDFVLSGTGAGSVVSGSTPGLNNGLLAGGGTFDFFNTDNSGLAGVNTYSLGDVVYYNSPSAAAPADAFVSVGDVQLTVSPTGVAGSFGHVQTAADANTVYDLTATGAALAGFCYIDTDGSGAFSPSEPVYLQPAACGALAAGHVRVANPTVGAAGSQVTGVDNDVGRASLALTHIVCFFDSNGDGRFSASGSDVLYASVPVGGVCATAKIGDFVLSGTGAGSVVSGSTSGLNNALAAGAGVLSFFNADNNAGYSLGDVVVYDGPGVAVADGLLGVGDVQLTASPTGVTGTYGHVGTAADAYVTYSLLAAAATDPDTFCYIDTDGSGAFSPTEPVYFRDTSVVGTAVQAGTIRIANPSTGTVGSQVTGTDVDIGRACIVAGFATAFFFFDSNGDGRFSASGSDVLYQKGGAGAAVAIGDIVLSGTNAGQVVSGSTAGLNNALTAGAGAVAVFDQDGSGAYSLGDSLYYEGIGLAAADAFSTTGDVQLTGPAPTGGLGGTTPPPPTTTPVVPPVTPVVPPVTPVVPPVTPVVPPVTPVQPVTPTPPSPPSDADADGGDADGDEDDGATPGFEVIALVAALGAALLLVRRKL